MKTLIVFLTALLTACVRDGATEYVQQDIVIPSPSFTLTPKLFVDFDAPPSEERDYVLAVGAIRNRHTQALIGVTTELRIFWDRESWTENRPFRIGKGKIGFLKANHVEGLEYETDTLRTDMVMHHWTRTPGFYWGGNEIYYDFRVNFEGVSKKFIGVFVRDGNGIGHRIIYSEGIEYVSAEQ